MSQYTGGRKAGPKVVAARDRVAKLARENAEVNALYNDLIMCVAQKWPGETRHQTARRYILERENRAHEAGEAKQVK